jgi:hypothetical protein
MAPSFDGHIAITGPSKLMGVLTGIASFPGSSYALTLSVAAAPAAETSSNEPAPHGERTPVISLPQSLVPVTLLGAPLS